MIKLLFKLSYRFRVKQLKTCISLNYQLTATLIKKEMFARLPNASFKSIYYLSADITSKLFYNHEIDENSELYLDFKGDISSLLNDMQDSEEIKKRISTKNQLFDDYAHLILGSSSNTNTNDKTKPNLDFQSFQTLKQDLKDQLVQQRKSLEALQNQRVEQIREEVFPKITFRLDKLVSWIAILTSIVFLSGYYLTSQILEHFGINSAMYFQVTDYLASSINNIQTVIISSFVGVGFYVYGVHKSISEAIFNNQFEIVKTSYTRNDKFVLFVVLSGLIGLAINLIFNFESGFYRALQILFYLGGLFIVLIIPFEKYFSNHVFVRIIVSVLVIQFFQVERAIDDNISRITSNYQSTKIVYKFKDNPLPLSDLSLISSTSVYYFFYENASNKTLIVKREVIESIEIDISESEQSSLFAFLRSFFKTDTDIESDNKQTDNL